MCVQLGCLPCVLVPVAQHAVTAGVEPPGHSSGWVFLGGSPEGLTILLSVAEGAGPSCGLHSQGYPNAAPHPPQGPASATTGKDTLGEPGSLWLGSHFSVITGVSSHQRILEALLQENTLQTQQAKEGRSSTVSAAQGQLQLHRWSLVTFASEDGGRPHT